MDYAVVFVVGLIVGWNFLPQPEFVKNIIEKIKSKFVKKDEVV